MQNLYSYYLQVFFLTAIVVNHLTEVYLIRRQLKTLREAQDQVPAEFAEVLSLEQHQKSIRYSSTKLRLSGAKLFFDAAILFFWFPFRGAENLYLALPEIGVHKEVAFLVLFSLFQYALQLPWSIYSTFVVEETFGFNKTIVKTFILDRLKAGLLSGIVGLPLLYGIFACFRLFPNWWWLVSFAILTAFQFLLVWIYPVFIAPWFNKFSPLEDIELKQGIEGLVQSAGFRATEVFVMDASRRSSHGNAYFTGFGKNKRIVFFDTLLKDLEVPEVLAILAHELGHLKLRHIPKSLAASLVFSFIGFWLLGNLANSYWFYTGHFIRFFEPGPLLLIFTQAIPLYTFWFTPVGSLISRKREFEADAYAAKEARPGDLVSGLLKLYRQNASPVVTDSVFSGFYHSHPPALERIKRLEEKSSTQFD